MGEGSGHLLWRRLSTVGATFVSLIYPAVALVILGMALADLPNALHAARNEGVPGTFVVVRKDCKPRWEKGGGCTSFGDFVSNDGTLRLSGVLFEGKPGPVGAVVPAQVVDPASNVVDEVGSDEWVFNVAMVLVTAGYLVWRVVRAVRRRRSRIRSG